MTDDCDAPRESRSRPHGVARVLIVDGSAHVRRSLGRAFGLVADVTVGANGEDALAILRAEAPFDLVLCDTTPGLVPGAELWREALRVSPESAAHFVFLTGDPELLGPDLAEAPCLAKPLDREQIDALVAGLSLSRAEPV